MFSSVWQDIIFVISSLSDCIPDVDSKQILFIKIRGYFRIDIFVEKKPPFRHITQRLAPHHQVDQSTLGTSPSHLHDWF